MGHAKPTSAAFKDRHKVVDHRCLPRSRSASRFITTGEGKMRKFKKSVLAIAAMAFAAACSDPTMPTRTLVDGSVSATVTKHTIFFMGGGTFPAGLGAGVL